MCVIAYIPAGVHTPSNNTFYQIYQCNPHGIGIATPNGISKTLSFTKFLTDIKRRDISDPCIIHFRYATHGSVSVKNCHPFHDDATGITFAHNGVLPISSQNDQTDSELFFRNTALPLFNQHGILSDNALYEIDQQRHGSRFIFMHDRHIIMQGDYTQVNNVYYSNTRWLYRLYY